MSGKRRLTDEQRAANLRKASLAFRAATKSLDPHSRVVGIKPEAHDEVSSLEADFRGKNNLGNGCRRIPSRKPCA